MKLLQSQLKEIISNATLSIRLYTSHSTILGNSDPSSDRLLIIYLIFVSKFYMYITPERRAI